MAADDRREQAIGLAIGQIEKQFGKGSIMRLGADAVLPDIKVIPTGSLSLDIALGVGGLPRGRIIEIYEIFIETGESNEEVKAHV